MNVVLPMLVTGPIAAVLFALVVVHLVYLVPHTLPMSRRRIRRANGLVMLVAIPLVFAGFSLVSHRTQPALWATVWVAAGSLLVFAVVLALVDMLNTMRLHRSAQVRLRHDLRRRSDAHVSGGNANHPEHDRESERSGDGL